MMPVFGMNQGQNVNKTQGNENINMMGIKLGLNKEKYQDNI